jgi:peptide subunit release factor 1 (eRF1)
MIDASAAEGRAVVGAEATLYALTAGQVEELIISARPEVLGLPESRSTDSNGLAVDSTAPQADATRLELAGELVARGQQNAARIRFIEDSALLRSVGGVGAILRFRT